MKIFNFTQSLPQKKEFKYFNQPIDFQNQELFYYKNRINLYYDFYSNDYLQDNMLINIQNKKNVIEKIISGKYFENEIIKNDETRINLLIYLIIYPSQSEFMLNLLKSTTLTDDQLNKIIDEVKTNNDFNGIDYNQICIENYELSKQYENFDERFYKTYEKEIEGMF